MHRMSSLTAVGCKDVPHKPILHLTGNLPGRHSNETRLRLPNHHILTSSEIPVKSGADGWLLHLLIQTSEVLHSAFQKL